MTDSKEESRQNKKPEVKQDIDPFDDFLSKISSANLPDPSACGLAFNPMTMEYEQTCGYGPNGEPEFLDDFDDDD